MARPCGRRKMTVWLRSDDHLVIPRWLGRPWLLGLEVEVHLRRSRRRRRPAVDLQLAEDVAQARFDSALADPQLDRDRLVGPAVENQPEHRALARRQRLCRVEPGPGPGLGKPLHLLAGHRSVHLKTPGAGLLDPAGQVLGAADLAPAAA